MIKFSLRCDQGHDFEAWFRDSGDFDTQKKRGFLECPSCGSNHVEKALMAPSVATARKREEVAVAIGNAAQREIMSKLREMAREVRKSGEDVGNRFPEEARKIHYGETEKRNIYGEASEEEAKELSEEGVPVTQIPWIEKDN